jgi:indole-3-acetate monooxygenase
MIGQRCRAARDLQPRIIAQRDAIETYRRLPEDLTRDLAPAGFFRIFLPAAYGGLDLTPMDGIAVFEALAKADASVAWCVWNGDTHWSSAQLSSEAAHAIHDDPDPICRAIGLTLPPIFQEMPTAQTTQDPA